MGWEVLEITNPSIIYQRKHYQMNLQKSAPLRKEDVGKGALRTSLTPQPPAPNKLTSENNGGFLLAIEPPKAPNAPLIKRNHYISYTVPKHRPNAHIQNTTWPWEISSKTKTCGLYEPRAWGHATSALAILNNNIVAYPAMTSSGVIASFPLPFSILEGKLVKKMPWRPSKLKTLT